MARKKQAAAAENTEGWLTTYADLISLLLCFFVLMYAASTPDEAKMKWILQAMTPISGEIVNPVHVDDPMDNSQNDIQENIAPDIELPSNDDGDVVGVEGDLPMTFDDLFNWVSDAIESNNLNASISVSEAHGRIHIRFDSDVMFEADSHILLPEGVRMLRLISSGITAVEDYVRTVEVGGHTSALASGRRTGIDDWFLSSMRAVAVTNQLDYGFGMVAPDKFLPMGYAQWEPYHSNETEDGRAKNRRVELVVIRNDYNLGDTSLIVDMLAYDYQLAPLPQGPDGTRHQPPGQFDRDQQIRAAIWERYRGDEPMPLLPSGGEFGSAIPSSPSNITRDMLDPERTAAAAAAATTAD